MPRRAFLALSGAGVGIALLALTWFLAFHVSAVNGADQSILRGFSDLGRHPRVGSLADFFAGLCNPNPYFYLAAIPIAVAAVRRRGWLTIAISAILLGANVATQLLKPLLAQSRPSPVLGTVSPVGAASWPSGHATAAMALALCCVLAAPARARRYVAAAGAVFAVAVSYSLLSLQSHYASDVFGGFLIAGTWTLLGVAAVYVVDGRRGVATEPGSAVSVREALEPPGLALIVAVGLVGLALLARPHQVVDYARLHHAFVIGAIAIAITALALASGLALALRGGSSGSGPAATAAPRHRWPRG